MAKKKKYGSGTGTPAMNITNNPNATQMPKKKPAAKKKPLSKAESTVLKKFGPDVLKKAQRKVAANAKKASAKKKVASGSAGRVAKEKRQVTAGKRNVPRLKGRAYKKGTREAAARSH